jgi:Xaa-Pro aminopeptidase
MRLLYRGEQFDANFFYATGFDIDHSFFLDKPRVLFVPKLNFTLAKSRFKGRVIDYTKITDSLKPFVKRRTVEFDARAMPASVYLRLKKICKLKDVSEKLSADRMVKKPQELQKMKRAVKITKKILSELEKKLKRREFKTQHAVRAFLMKRTFELGCEPAYDPIVATDPNSRFPHYQSGKDAKLKNMVLIDFGVRYEHYCADLTRCYFLRRNKEMEKNYQLLRKLFREIILALPNVKTGKQLAIFVEKLYKKNGLPPLPHSIGHGIGLDVHELPRLSKRFNDLLKPGMMVAIEPSCYFKAYGLRFEETIYLDKTKARVL